MRTKTCTQKYSLREEKKINFDIRDNSSRKKVKISRKTIKSSIIPLSIQKHVSCKSIQKHFPEKQFL